jgi:serine/threonine protein kinase/tetratricopeptide (TPR) repeat protein
MIGKTISHYNILEKLGEGGMGVVYKAEDSKLRRTVALKFLSQELNRNEQAKNRFIQEARAASALDHPNICVIHEFDQTEEGELFFVMGFYMGESLRERLDRGQLSIKETIEIFTQIARGLSRAHRAGIIHRDIKPSNIFITRDNVVKILDFGVAKLMGDTKIITGGTASGTIDYMSPEQLMDEVMDVRTDIWSMGVILYQLVTGNLPFKGEFEQTVIYSILKEKYEPVTSFRDDVPKVLLQIINKSLTKNPDERYQQVEEILNQLQSVNAEINNLPTFPFSVRTTKTLKKPVYFLGLIVVLILLIFASFLFFHQSPVSGQPKVMAVLPFENLSGNPANNYFVDGITDNIITQISKIKNLKVISRAAVLPYKSDKKNLKDIGRELNVGIILEGSLRKEENRVEIVVNLVNAPSKELLWNETYDRELSDIFTIQRDITEKIASALDMKLSQSEIDQIKEIPTFSPTAYDYTLRGFEYYRIETKESNEFAIDFFKKSLEKDPKFALAYVGLGKAYFKKEITFGFDRAWLDSAAAMCLRAIEIDNHFPDAYFTLGTIYQKKYWYNSDFFQKANSAFQKAIELNPSNVEALIIIGIQKLEEGKYEEALTYLNQALVLNPKSPGIYSDIGHAYFYLRNYEKAEEYYFKALEMKPDWVEAYIKLAEVYGDQGKIKEAIQTYQTAIHLDPSQQWAHHDLAVCYQNAGNFEDAITKFEKVLEISPTQPWHYIGLAGVYYEQGRYIEAITVFERALKLISDANLLLNYSFVLSRMGKSEMARQVLQKNEDKLLVADPWLRKIIQFYLGEIEEQEVKLTLKQVENSAHKATVFADADFYLGMAYLLNLKQDFTISPGDTTKAIECFRRYLKLAHKSWVGYPIARLELQRLGVQY